MGSFSIDQLPQYRAPALGSDKAGKDTNFRGLTVYNNVVYYTKGSGSNGINTVYFVDTSGTRVHGHRRRPAELDRDTAAAGMTYPMCVLSGFNTGRAKLLTTNPGGADTTGGYPFGIWFASPTTVYVADEGSGDNTYDSTTNSYPNANIPDQQYPAGLQKYTLTNGKWVLDYTIQNGLNLGVPYTVKGYPTGDNDSYQRHGPPVGARDGRSAQHQRTRQRRRHGDDLCHDLDGQRQR